MVACYLLESQTGELFYSVFIETLSNLIWVAIVFVVLFFRDRRKKERLDSCLEAYLMYLLKSTIQVRNCVYPYVYLIQSKAHHGTILPTLLDSIYQLAAGILDQTQNTLALVESRKLQEKILSLHQKVTLFQSHVSASRIAADIVVGDPTQLIEPPQQQREMDTFTTFVRDFDKLVREIKDAFPTKISAKIPQDIVSLLDQKGSLQDEVEKS